MSNGAPCNSWLMLTPGLECHPSPSRVTVNANIWFDNFPRAGDLVNAFYLPLTGAAKKRGMSVTTFKALGRKRGINRWPFRCFKSMNPKRSTNVVTAPVTQPVDECTSFVNSVLDDLNTCLAHPSPPRSPDPPPPRTPEENTRDDVREAIRNVLLYSR